jgi:chromate transporter
VTVPGKPSAEPPHALPSARPSLARIAHEHARIGCTGFGGPPALIALLRRLYVEDEGWLSAEEFQDGIAAASLLPGPAAKQLGIYCAWRMRGAAGAIIGGICFSVPGLVMIIALAALFLSEHPPLWVQGAAAGAGAAVAAVAVRAAVSLMPSSWQRMGATRAVRTRWLVYVLAGALSAATLGPYLVLVMLVCGLAEIAAHTLSDRSRTLGAVAFLPSLAAATASGGLAALAWVAFKVGALSYGGGFVIVPMMQSDAVDRFHWMTAGQFLTAVALGQITPGPVVQTVAVVGYAAAGLIGAVLASIVAFAPSFVFVLVGARHFHQLRTNTSAQSFLTGAGPAAIGAIAGASLPLALAISQAWQIAILGAAVLWIVVLRRNLVLGLVAAAALGVGAALIGLPVGG